MTKKKSAKRAFISSFMSFVMCFAMLAGTTFAWYTDSVTSSGNKIVAGSLDIELWKYEPDTSVDGRDTDGYVNISESGAPIFQSANLAQNSTATLWEPGKTQVAYLKIKNNGDLALKYSVAIDVRNIAKDLYKVMKYAIVPDATQAVGVSPWAGIPDTSVKSVVPGTNPTGFSDITMPKNAVHAFALVIHMDEEAGNEYMAGEVDFDLRVLATQEAYEADSFGTDYDANAEYPVISTSSVTMTGAATEALEIQSVGEIKSASVPAAAANTVFEEMKDDEAESNELTLTLNVTKTGEVTTTAGTTVALEIDMTAVMEKTKAGVTTTTSEGVTTFSDFITIQYDLGAGLSNVTATHKGNAMVNSTNTAEDAGNGIYSYDSATGILTIKTTKLSPFAVSYNIAVSGLTLSAESASMKPNDTLQLTATVAPENATQKTVTWTSSNEAIATVSASGLVTAVAGGNATITATAGGVSATCEVSIVPANAIFKLIPNDNEDNYEYLTASQLDGENGLLTNKYKAGNYTLELLKNADIDLAGSGYSNFFSSKFAVGDGAKNVVIDLKGYTLTFKDTSYGYAGSYLMAYDCENLTICNGTLKSTLLGGNWPLFASWCSESVTMENVTLINITNNRDW